MGKPKEDSVENWACAHVESLGGWAIKLKNPGFRGLPDRMILLHPRIVFFVEFKRPGGGEVAPQQRRIHKAIRKLGFPVYLCDNTESFEDICEKEIRFA